MQKAVISGHQRRRPSGTHFPDHGNSHRGTMAGETSFASFVFVG